MKWFPRTWPSSFLLRTLLQCVVLAGYGLLALIGALGALGMLPDDKLFGLTAIVLLFIAYQDVY